MNKWNRNKIMTTIGWASIITSIPWIIGASVIVIKFSDQKQVINKSKLEEEKSKTKNKQLDTKIKKNDNKIKALEVEKQISTKTINQLKDKNKQQEIVHNEWYVKNSQIEIAKLEKGIKESKIDHDESVKKLEDNAKKLEDNAKKLNDNAKKLENEISILEASKSSIIGGENKSIKKLQDNVKKLENEISILEASKSSIKENHDKLKINYDKKEKELEKQKMHMSMVRGISPTILWEEIRNSTYVKDQLNVTWILHTTETTKSPIEVTYTNFNDVVRKTKFAYWDKEDQRKFEATSIKVEVIENHDDFQIVKLSILKKGGEKIIAWNTIKITNFKSKP